MDLKHEEFTLPTFYAKHVDVILIAFTHHVYAPSPATTIFIMYCPFTLLQRSVIVASIACILFLVTCEAYQNDTVPTQLVYQYNPITWVENLAVRPNGFILPITTTSPLLKQLDPMTGNLELVHDFSDYGNAIQGITEVTPDVFAVDVLTCNITALTCTKGSVSTWLVNFRSDYDHSEGRGKSASVRLVGSFPSAGFLNGMAALNDNIVVIADSFLGGIWSLNLHTGNAKLIFTDKSMKPTNSIVTGINGLRARPGWLYYTDSAKGTFNRISINSQTGDKTGAAEIIASGLLAPDDLEIDDEAGTAYVCNGAANEVLRIPLDGSEIKVVAQIPGPTSVRWACAYGYQSHAVAEKVLYASDVGGLLQYIEGNVTLGGAIYRVDV